MQFIYIILSFIVFSFSANAAQNQVNITIKGDYRYITSNGIPNHSVGSFPNRNNPNSISTQNHQYKVPVHPKVSGLVTYLKLSPFGVAINGIPFDPGAAEFWNNDRSSGWQYEALSGFINLGMDKNNAHVQPNGSYHYHGLPTGLIKNISSKKHSPLIGYAADGFPIYALYGYKNAKNSNSSIKLLSSSYKLKNGTRRSGPKGKYDGKFVADYQYVKNSGDLDECNGRFGVTPDYPDGTYYYFITNKFPFIPRCFKGVPDMSFSHAGANGGNMPGGHPPGRKMGHSHPPPPR